MLPIETIEKYRQNRLAADSETRFKILTTSADFSIDWCGNLIQASRNSIVVDEEPILELTPSENDLEPILISGTFRDQSGRAICKISRNEIVAKARMLGDFTLVSNRFSFTDTSGQVALRFQLTSSNIVVDRIFHTKQDAFVFGADEQLLVGNLGRSALHSKCEFYDADLAPLK
ncbi:hypothetical protein BC361_13795 [Ensifer sp. LC54]|nr:hypothetical protein BC363_09260 [Ensifer sp. LC384]OCP27807.1 hypothetical protein BC361_13795 [Ensifer sp. LC54]